MFDAHLDWACRCCGLHQGRAHICARTRGRPRLRRQTNTTTHTPTHHGKQARRRRSDATNAPEARACGRRCRSSEAPRKGGSSSDPSTMTRCTTTSNSATTAKEASRNNLEGWHLMCSGAGSRRLICVGVCGVTNGIGAPACLRKIHLVKHRHPLVHLFPPGTHPTHVHSALFAMSGADAHILACGKCTQLRQRFGARSPLFAANTILRRRAGLCRFPSQAVCRMHRW